MPKRIHSIHTAIALSKNWNILSGQIVYAPAVNSFKAQILVVSNGMPMPLNAIQIYVCLLLKKKKIF
jgi:hypothetical protein